MDQKIINALTKGPELSCKTVFPQINLKSTIISPWVNGARVQKDYKDVIQGHV